MSALVAAPGLARATYCPRQPYYARHDGDRTPPPTVHEVHALVFDCPDLLDAIDDELASWPVSVSPAMYREHLTRLRERDDWDVLTDPVACDKLFVGKGCHGVVHRPVGVSGGKGDRPPVPVPSLVSLGEPPERGVWGPQRVRVVVLAKMLTWEREAPVPWMPVGYPVAGVARTVGLAIGNKAACRRVLRVACDLDFVPSRLRDSARCESCTYRERCGVETWLLSLLLGR